MEINAVANKVSAVFENKQPNILMRLVFGTICDYSLADARTKSPIKNVIEFQIISRNDIISLQTCVSIQIK